MSLHVKRGIMSDIVAQVLRIAFTDSRAKRLMREINRLDPDVGCSIDTAKRILATGRVSGRLWPAVSRIVFAAFDTVRGELDKFETAIRDMESEVALAEMRPRDPSRDSAGSGATRKLDDGAKTASVTPERDQ